MASSSLFVFAFVLHILLVSAATKQTYIVKMKHHQKPTTYNTHSDWYTHLFHSLTSSTTQDSLLYTYDVAYKGFAAAMSPEEAESLRRSDSVLGVHEDKLYTLQTTRTPLFLGLNNPGLWPGHSPEQLHEASQDIIIGMVDTGVWPESPSFRDDCMPDVPGRWRGKCEPGDDPTKTNFCNRKLIGARFFGEGYKWSGGGGGSNESRSARDNDGHGTHTASTAAGSPVANASLFGYGRGTARGMAYKARLAAYKVCWDRNCYASDIIAGMDSAIADGVDVLSLSVIFPSSSYDDDPIAVGAFAAMERGIFVSCAAGNDGPDEASLHNVAPWIMTVGAGTLDRDFPAYVTLGNGEKYIGASSLCSGLGMKSNRFELVYSDTSASKLCLPGSLDPNIVSGKVVLCDRGGIDRLAKGAVVRDAGGAGMILANTEEYGENLFEDCHYLPTLMVGSNVGDKIRRYVMSSSHSTVLLTFVEAEVNVKPSPVVAAFSSRGPNTMTPQILKPDIIAPGVNILAAWSGALGPTLLPEDPRRTEFNIIFGTSMSCPHVSGLAALLRAAHPKWSPSAVKSALMTTAYTLDNTNSPLHDAADNTISTPWAHGAGHVNLHKALSPGLVYDATTKDYTVFLCSLNYTMDMIRFITNHSNINCTRKYSDPGQLNYPSFSVVFDKSRLVRYTRVLTNVGAPLSVYRVKVEAPPNVMVIVKPTVLVFRSVGDKQWYTVTFISHRGVDGLPKFGSISWENAKNQVKSPISFTWTTQF